MIGFKIKKIREGQNKSREDIASYIGICLRTYSKIETNERMPSLDELKKMAEYFKVDPYDLQYNEPKIGFEQFDNNNFDSSIAQQHSSILDLLKHYEAIISNNEKVIMQKDRIIESQLKMIELLQDQSNTR